MAARSRSPGADLNPPGVAGHYRPDIDGLRGIAVLSVVAYHAFPKVARSGFTGVDVFFVISGFLISGLILEDLRRGRFSFTRFYARRFRRIFPALIVVLAACLLYGSFALAPDQLRELGKQAAAGAGFSSNFLQWQQAGYFDQKATTKPLLHLWSLGVEEQFYIAWPILLIAAYGRGRRLLYVSWGLLLVSFVISIIATYSHPSAAFYLPLPRFWELLTGALLAYRSHSAEARTRPLEHDPRVSWRAAAGLALISAGFLCIDSGRAFPGWWALLPVLGTALMISAPQAWLNRRLLSARPLVLIGLISYPLYLWHWVVLTFARIANLDEELPRTLRLAAIAASVLLAWLTYRWIERPIRFGARRDAIPRPLLAAMAACGLAGLVLYFTNGLAFRYPAEIRTLAAFDYDNERDFYEQSYRGGECFLSATESFDGMAQRCVDPGPARLVALWGDSHAASLYPGLRAAQKDDAFRIAQFTASACPPLLGFTGAGRPHCAAFNAAVLQELRVLAPDLIILEAHWALYTGERGGSRFDAALLRRTIEQLEAAGLRHIVVMGSLPTWKIYAPRVAFEIWRRGEGVQSRTAEFLDPEPFAADRAVRSAVAGTQARFISPLDLMCAQGICQIFTSPHATTTIAWDNDHLSLAGSAFLADHAFKSLLGAPVPPT